VVRLFAEFEAGLRDVWTTWAKKATVPKMEDLLNALAARRQIPDDRRNAAQAVRRYRNALVHEGSEGGESVAVDRTRKVLCTFFSYMPLDW
jgi:hypothetical protein